MKTSRKYGAVWNAIREFSSKIPRFTADDLTQCRDVTRKQAVENLPKLVKSNELRIVSRGDFGFTRLATPNPKDTVYERINNGNR